ncbi:MAG TPA: carboxylesterase family protein [Candidatus Faecivivens stercoripullorum]|uniref:Carboxylic ester hydrolase n=1 Tax=Candidatus Faecivivens stercoripullorum TaxID=2840805 RepID=A0A9D1H8K2_9FIRM|nr:carboxylesterase family protein [Candidatus Faecivivens stercoripullorum]
MSLVYTQYGALRGKRKDGCITYFGVPYAQPPVGDLRWKAPQPLQPWTGEREAFEFPHRAWQMVQEPPVDGKGINYAREFYSNPAFMPPMDEDCLYLNIWRPLTGEKLPVAFWIHGGALINGFGSELEFDGEAFARKGVILVTINYRLGAFGFLCHPELAKEDPNGRCGNYGIFDQIAALKWVKENIAAFGGDPDKITIFGQSAGAMSVQTLLSSPLSRDMMAGAIMQSAGGYQAGVLKDRTMEEAMEQGHLFSKLTGANTLEKMRALPPEKIMQAVTVMMAEGFRTGSGLPFTAVIDGYLMEKGYDQVVEDGECPDIPYMIGSCGNDLGQTPEMTMRGGHSQLYYGCINWSLKNAELGRTPAYVYYFDRKLLGDYSGAFHSAELWYVFNTLSRSWRPKSQADYRLAEQINSYWVNFIKTGNPNGEDLPYWKPCSWDSHHVQLLDVDNA